MQLIYENPYRILGLSNTATDREIAKRVSNLSVYAEMGKAVNYDYDFVDFSPLERTIDTIKDAERKLEQPKNKLLHSLFWISYDENNPLIDLNINTQSEIINNITNSNAFDLHNKAIITLFSKNDFNTIRTGINYFNEFLTHPNFNEFVKMITGKSSSINYDVDELFFDELFREIIKKFEPKEIVDLFKNTSKEDHIKSTLIKPIIHNIESEIEIARNKTTKEPEKAYSFGKELIENSSDNLNSLEDILDESDMMLISISNKLAEQILDCSIAYFNKNYESSEENIGSNTLELVEYSKQIAMSNMLAQRINSNYTIIRDYHETREICFFCNRNNKIKKKRKRIELYKVTAWDSKSINYKMINVDVPRCANCARLQFSNNFFGFLLGSLLLYIIGILIYQIEDWGVLILGFIGLLIIFTFSKFGKFLFSFVYKFTIRILYKIFFHKKFKTKKEIYKSFQPVVDLLSKNWQVNEPKR